MDPQDAQELAKRILKARDRIAPRFPDVDPGDLLLIVESVLEDVIRSKEAAGRAKDLAMLPILRDTLRVKKALEEEPS
jgi:hypothetical protein